MRNVSLFLSLSLLVVPLAAAQSYPNKPVRIIVGFTSGASADIVARLIGPRLSEALGQSVIVDNRPGAGGVVGATMVAKSAPDGYNLLMGTPGALTINPVLLSDMPYDVSRDFAPVTLVNIVPSILLVTPGLPVKSVKELIAHLKTTPGQLNFASAGNGTVPHLACELFMLLTGTKLVHVPYKGSAAAMPDMISGRISVFFDNMASGLPFVQSEKLRGLAVTSRARSKLAPNLPTMIESGVPGYEVASWGAVVAPARTPDAVVSRLNAEFVKILSDPQVRAQLQGLGVEVVGSSVDELRALLQRERAQWAKVVKDAKITVE